MQDDISLIAIVNRVVVHRSESKQLTRDRIVKIMDFGLAKILEEVRRQTTVVGGTPFEISWTGPGNPRDFITIVSGLPRSGTSLMMQMLEAGGVPVLTDGLRAADDDNPKGYYEFELVKTLHRRRRHTLPLHD